MQKKREEWKIVYNFNNNFWWDDNFSCNSEISE